MKIKIIVSSICIIILFCAGCYFYQYKMNNFYSHIPSEYKTSVENAIKTSGNDRNIKIALLLVNGNDLNAMCDMVSRMSPIDLCNLTPLKFVNHVKTTYKTNKQFSWVVSKDTDLFKNYILPNRTSAEPLFLDRNKMKRMLYPYIKDCKTSTEAVEAIMKQFVSTEEKNKYFLGSTYPYDYSPIDCVTFGITGGEWTCRSKTIFLVEALRSIGIPAIKAEVAAWLFEHNTHTFIDYYDTTDNNWHMTEVENHNPINNQFLIETQKARGSTVMLCNPSYPQEDYYGKKTFYKLTDMGNNNLATGNISVITKGNNNKPVDIDVYIWYDDLNSWYPAQKIKTDNTGKAKFMLGAAMIPSKKCNPYLIVVGLGNKVVCKSLDVLKDGDYKLTFDLNNANKALDINLK